MLDISDIKPLQRQALLAALTSPTRSLQRTRFGYVGATGTVTVSGIRHIAAFTGRLLNMLERDGLVDFDEPQWPNTATLTPAGLALAEQLQAAEQAKAGVA